MLTDRVSTHESLVFARHYARDLLQDCRPFKYNLFSSSLPFFCFTHVALSLSSQYQCLSPLDSHLLHYIDLPLSLQPSTLNTLKNGTLFVCVKVLVTEVKALDFTLYHLFLVFLIAQSHCFPNGYANPG